MKAVLFDYGMVLCGPPDPASWDEMRLTLEADDPSFHHAYWEFRDAYDRGVLTGSAYWDAIAGRLGKTLSKDQRIRLLTLDVALWTRPNAAMIDWAASLQKAGIPTGILSNIGDAMEEGILARCPWLRQFSHLTFSHRLRMAKPEAAIYSRAADGLGLPHGEILFVDDREENVEAARAAGMQALLYKDHATFVSEMTERGFGALLRPH